MPARPRAQGVAVGRAEGAGAARGAGLPASALGRVSPAPRLPLPRGNGTFRFAAVGAAGQRREGKGTTTAERGGESKAEEREVWPQRGFKRSAWPAASRSPSRGSDARPAAPSEGSARGGGGEDSPRLPPRGGGGTAPRAHLRAGGRHHRAAGGGGGFPRRALPERGQPPSRAPPSAAAMRRRWRPARPSVCEGRESAGAGVRSVVVLKVTR